MTDAATPPVKSQEERMADLAPEMHNDEQDDHRSQAQEIALQAKHHREAAGAVESLKLADPASNFVGSGEDVIDQMQNMEDSGSIDMDAYEGEPNHDDNVDKYGKDKNPDGLRGDGT